MKQLTLFGGTASPPTKSGKQPKSAAKSPKSASKSSSRSSSKRAVSPRARVGISNSPVSRSAQQFARNTSPRTGGNSQQAVATVVSKPAMAVKSARSPHKSASAYKTPGAGTNQQNTRETERSQRSRSLASASGAHRAGARSERKAQRLELESVRPMLSMPAADSKQEIEPENPEPVSASRMHSRGARQSAPPSASSRTEGKGTSMSASMSAAGSATVYSNADGLLDSDYRLKPLECDSYSGSTRGGQPMQAVRSPGAGSLDVLGPRSPVAKVLEGSMSLNAAMERSVNNNGKQGSGSAPTECGARSGRAAGASSSSSTSFSSKGVRNSPTAAGSKQRSHLSRDGQQTSSEGSTSSTGGSSDSNTSKGTGSTSSTGSSSDSSREAAVPSSSSPIEIPSASSQPPDAAARLALAREPQASRPSSSSSKAGTATGIMPGTGSSSLMPSIKNRFKRRRSKLTSISGRRGQSATSSLVRVKSRPGTLPLATQVAAAKERAVAVQAGNEAFGEARAARTRALERGTQGGKGQAGGMLQFGHVGANALDEARGAEAAAGLGMGEGDLTEEDMAFDLDFKLADISGQQQMERAEQVGSLGATGAQNLEIDLSDDAEDGVAARGIGPNAAEKAGVKRSRAAAGMGATDQRKQLQGAGKSTSMAKAPSGGIMIDLNPSDSDDSDVELAASRPKGSRAGDATVLHQVQSKAKRRRIDARVTDLSEQHDSYHASHAAAEKARLAKQKEARLKTKKAMTALKQSDEYKMQLELEARRVHRDSVVALLRRRWEPSLLGRLARAGQQGAFTITFSKRADALVSASDAVAELVDRSVSHLFEALGAPVCDLEGNTLFSISPEESHQLVSRYWRPSVMTAIVRKELSQVLRGKAPKYTPWSPQHEQTGERVKRGNEDVLAAVSSQVGQKPHVAAPSIGGQSALFTSSRPAASPSATGQNRAQQSGNTHASEAAGETDLTNPNSLSAYGLRVCAAFLGLHATWQLVSEMARDNASQKSSGQLAGGEVHGHSKLQSLIAACRFLDTDTLTALVVKQSAEDVFAAAAASDAAGSSGDTSARAAMQDDDGDDDPLDDRLLDIAEALDMQERQETKVMGIEEVDPDVASAGQAVEAANGSKEPTAPGMVRSDGPGTACDAALESAAARFTLRAAKVPSAVSSFAPVSAPRQADLVNHDVLQHVQQLFESIELPDRTQAQDDCDFDGREAFPKCVPAQFDGELLPALRRWAAGSGSAGSAASAAKPSRRALCLEKRSSIDFVRSLWAPVSSGKRSRERRAQGRRRQGGSSSDSSGSDESDAGKSRKRQGPFLSQGSSDEEDDDEAEDEDGDEDMMDESTASRRSGAMYASSLRRFTSSESGLGVMRRAAASGDEQAGPRGSDDSDDRARASAGLLQQLEMEEKREAMQMEEASTASRSPSPACHRRGQQGRSSRSSDFAPERRPRSIPPAAQGQLGGTKVGARRLGDMDAARNWMWTSRRVSGTVRQLQLGSSRLGHAQPSTIVAALLHCLWAGLEAGSAMQVLSDLTAMRRRHQPMMYSTVWRPRIWSQLGVCLSNLAVVFDGQYCLRPLPTFVPLGCIDCDVPAVAEPIEEQVRGCLSKGFGGDDDAAAGVTAPVGLTGPVSSSASKPQSGAKESDPPMLSGDNSGFSLSSSISSGSLSASLSAGSGSGTRLVASHSAGSGSTTTSVVRAGQQQQQRGWGWWYGQRVDRAGQLDWQASVPQCAAFWRHGMAVSRLAASTYTVDLVHDDACFQWRLWAANSEPSEVQEAMAVPSTSKGKQVPVHAWARRSVLYALLCSWRPRDEDCECGGQGASPEGRARAAALRSRLRVSHIELAGRSTVAMACRALLAHAAVQGAVTGGCDWDLCPGAGGAGKGLAAAMPGLSVQSIVLAVRCIATVLMVVGAHPLVVAPLRAAVRCAIGARVRAWVGVALHRMVPPEFVQLHREIEDAVVVRKFR